MTAEGVNDKLISSAWIEVRDVEATDLICLGADHRGVVAKMVVEAIGKKKRVMKDPPSRVNMTRITEISKNEYTVAVEHKATDMLSADAWLSQSLSGKCALVEDALLECARGCRQAEEATQKS